MDSLNTHKTLSSMTPSLLGPSICLPRNNVDPGPNAKRPTGAGTNTEHAIGRAWRRVDNLTQPRLKGSELSDQSIRVLIPRRALKGIGRSPSAPCYSPSMPKIHTYLFDLDGTLIDSIRLILESYRHTLIQHRHEAPPDRFWLQGLGKPLREQLREVTQDPAEIEAMVETYREFNFLHHDSLVRPFPGIRAAVSVLKLAGANLGIVTSKTSKGLERGLFIGGLDDLFATRVSADDVSNHKPDPEPVLRALELLGVPTQGAVFIGDSPHDVAAGRAAGVLTAAVLWGPFTRAELQSAEPDYWLNDPWDITGLASVVKR
jgi:pyrophosphatase PpaX